MLRASLPLFLLKMGEKAKAGVERLPQLLLIMLHKYVAAYMC